MLTRSCGGLRASLAVESAFDIAWLTVQQLVVTCFCHLAAVHKEPEFLSSETRLLLIIPANMKKFFALLALAGIANAALAADKADSAIAQKVAMCIGCHGIPGYKATFPEVFQVPMIGGQSASYIESALKAYRKGERKHPSMRGIAEGLSDQDITDVAAYYAKQK